MTRSGWILVACLTSFYSITRIVLGIGYLHLPTSKLPPALQDWGLFPIGAWGILWVIAGALGLASSVTLFRGHLGTIALFALVSMNLIWSTAYAISWAKGEQFDIISTSTYSGVGALAAAAGVLIAVLRRKPVA